MLTWNVYNSNWNTDKIEVKNALDGYEKMFRDLYSKGYAKSKFAEEVDKTLKYRYWSRSEYEVVIADHICPDKIYHKTDIYSQIQINWPQFIDYVWNYFATEQKQKKIVKPHKLPKGGNGSRR